MKRITLTICTITLLLSACNNAAKNETTKDSTATTSDTSAKASTEEAWVPVDSATAMKAWMEYATPGESHKLLAKSSGNWSAEITHWMSPDAPPSKSTGSSSNKMVMDGRYQVSTFKAEFMGMPFEGMSTTGYDNAKKKFISTWVDNMGSGITKLEGPWDEATKSMTLTGTVIDPATGKDCEMKEVFKIVDDNTHIMEMYGPDPKTGKQYKGMEIKFTRKK